MKRVILIGDHHQVGSQYIFLFYGKEKPEPRLTLFNVIPSCIKKRHVDVFNGGHVGVPNQFFGS